jgi:hypothetical protein
MREWAAGTILLGLALSSAAQQVTQASCGAMHYSDELFHVTFEYPASWTFARDQPFYMPLSISYRQDSATPLPMRALVFAKSVDGVPPWPTTDLGGVEFGYEAHYVHSAEECRGLALTLDNHDGKIEQVKLNGISYWHGTAASAGLGHGIEEDIYTTLRTDSCLRFDLAVHLVNSGVDVPPRALGPKEQQLIRAGLTGILSSVRVTPAAR